MKRALVITICFSMLYAGVVSAFAECDALISLSAGHDHGDKNGEHHHNRDASTSHQADSGEIHCPNLFGVFLVGSRASVESAPRLSAAVDYQVLDLDSVLRCSASSRFDLGPPGPKLSQLRPLHLLLSVITSSTSSLPPQW